MGESKPSMVPRLPFAHVGEAVCELVVDAWSTFAGMCAAIEEARVAAIEEARVAAIREAAATAAAGTDMPAIGPVEPSIRRIDVHDGRLYTFLEVSRFYRGLGWSPHQIRHYWDFTMRRP
eukprot:TRINITY_DN12950_c0_g1_i1.p2 TRINITY_DN12950_c0_g1~~TRINITY_DN12950_c0_g1_i1.p2  ORF type:complete len:120 (-),score=17.85 TRINITY_DN12950_c0_g1_i1:194-553(-)